MTAADVETIKNCLLALVVVVGFIAGLGIGRAFSFWKW